MDSHEIKKGEFKISVMCAHMLEACGLSSDGHVKMIFKKRLPIGLCGIYSKEFTKIKMVMNEGHMLEACRFIK